MTGVASGIVIKEGTIAARFSSIERFRFGVVFVLKVAINISTNSKTIRDKQYS